MVLQSLLIHGVWLLSVAIGHFYTETAGKLWNTDIVEEKVSFQVKTPNFIIVYCDNLGYGDIEPFGSTMIRTPHLNRMAREGRKFTHFYVTAGVCTPSRASLMTGCYPRVGMHTNPRDGIVLRPISPYGLLPDEITIAEVLRNQGYKTGIIGKWHLGDQPSFLPTAQGFDSFYGVPYSDDMTQAVGKRLGDRLDGNQWPPLPLMLNDRVVEAGVDRNLLTKQVFYYYYAEQLQAVRSGPWKLFVPLKEFDQHPHFKDKEGSS